MDKTDKQLMLQYQQGDSMAFEVLYLRHKSKVYSYLKSRIFDSYDLEDVFQRVFMKMHKSRHLYRENFEVLPWIYTITKSELLDYFKRKKLNNSEFSEFKEEFHTVESAKIEGIDIQSQQSLSQKEKQVLESRYTEDKDFLEIAEALNISESNVRKIISRAIAKLKRSLT